MILQQQGYISHSAIIRHVNHIMMVGLRSSHWQMSNNNILSTSNILRKTPFYLFVDFKIFYICVKI
jgi:hypothetical protein